MSDFLSKLIISQQNRLKNKIGVTGNRDSWLMKVTRRSSSVGSRTRKWPRPSCRGEGLAGGRSQEKCPVVSLLKLHFANEEQEEEEVCGEAPKVRGGGGASYAYISVAGDFV